MMSAHGSVSSPPDVTRRRRPSHSLAILVLLIALVPAYVVPPAVRAAGCTNHCYSVAYEKSAGGYTGVKQTRSVLSLNNSSGSPIYQAMWLVWKTEPFHWVEVGTGYESGAKWNYGYFCLSDKANSCYFLFKWGASAGGPHSYNIKRDNTDHYRYYIYINGGQEGTVRVNYTSAIELHTGLESYNVSKLVDAHTYSNLQYRRGNNAFQDWAGKDGQLVQGYMCGRWASATQWWAAQNAPC